MSDSDTPSPEVDDAKPVPSGTVDPKLLEILVAPVTHNPLRYDKQKGELVDDKAGIAFPIRDGIPIMLLDEARELDESEMGSGT